MGFCTLDLREQKVQVWPIRSVVVFGGFPKLIFWGPYWDPPILGNYHLDYGARTRGLTGFIFGIICSLLKGIISLTSR